jgi:hypothetical protein
VRRFVWCVVGEFGPSRASGIQLGEHLVKLRPIPNDRLPIRGTHCNLEWPHLVKQASNGSNKSRAIDRLGI